ncbi:MAG: UPF0149 family protein [Burkholderiaceae bacterium]|nr:UPF0149 family protein [Burkholderiaceae bacterium]
MISLSPASTADLRPLDENDFHRLDALLDATGNENAMVVEEIDGFLAALACSPDPIGEDELLAQVLGAEPFEDVPASGASEAVPPETQAEIAALLRRHAARVIAALDAGEFGPVLSYDDEGNADGVAWAVGFLRAVELHPDSWDAMLDEKDFDDALDAMQSLAAALDEDAEDDGDAEDDDAEDDEAEDDERAPSAPGSHAERDALIDRMIGDVTDIHEYFRPWREAGTTPAAMHVETVRRTEPKIGRNEPCPCGSGRKYKNCCGAG